MTRIIMNKSVISDAMRINSCCDDYVAILKCSLVELHSNSGIYACIRGVDGEPINVYVASNRKLISKITDEDKSECWIEAVREGESDDVCACRRESDGTVKRSSVCLGVQTPTIPESTCNIMRKHSDKEHRVVLIENTKRYNETEMEALNKRSVMELKSIDSSGVDIIYFDGAEKLVRRLLYAGCPELTVFVTGEGDLDAVVRTLKKISHQAPFSNKISVVCKEKYAPASDTLVLVGRGEDVAEHNIEKIFVSVRSDGEETVAWVGQSTECPQSRMETTQIKPSLLYYATSVMSELVLGAVSKRDAKGRRLYRIEAQTLKTETVIRED